MESRRDGVRQVRQRKLSNVLPIQFNYDKSVNTNRREHTIQFAFMEEGDKGERAYFNIVIQDSHELVEYFPGILTAQHAAVVTTFAAQ